MTVKLLIRLLPCLLVLGFGAAALPGGSTNGLYTSHPTVGIEAGIGFTLRTQFPAEFAAGCTEIEFLRLLSELRAFQVVFREAFCQIFVSDTVDRGIDQTGFRQFPEDRQDTSCPVYILDVKVRVGSDLA